jgi:hypothetical protein
VRPLLEREAIPVLGALLAATPLAWAAGVLVAAALAMALRPELADAALRREEE